MDVDTINIITLAYLGDAVYEVYVRDYLIKNGYAKVIDLQKKAVSFVSAKNQSKILTILIDKKIINSNEIDIVKRGRNYKRASHPKNTDILTYKNSSGFEALIGYLYFTNRERLDYLMKFILEEYDEKNW